MLKNRKKLKVTLIEVHFLSLIAIIAGIFGVIASALLMRINENENSFIVTSILVVISSWNIILGIIELFTFIWAMITTKKELRKKLKYIYTEPYGPKTNTFQSFICMSVITFIIFLFIIIAIIL